MEERLITIATDHYTAAEILKARLESAGISCFLKNVNILQGAVSEGVKVQIKESDVEKALRIIMEIKAQQEEKEAKDSREIRRILVPVDFSDNSIPSCKYALRLAHKYNADIKIIHVFYAPIVDLVPITDAYSIQVDMDINLKEMEEQVRGKLNRFIIDVRQMADDQGFGNIKISYSLKEGIVEDEIATMAKLYKPGIIVMGTKGKGVKQSDIVGSVVNRVLDKTRIPVLAIPENADTENVTEVRNIVYATDFDESDYVAIRRLINIVADFNARIFCVHVSKNGMDKWDQVKMDNLKSYFDKVSPGVKVECSFIQGDNPVANLESFCLLNHINIIALTSKKRNILERLFYPGLEKKLIHSGSIPLLMFRG